VAINAIDWPTASTPSYTPDIEDDYNAQNENLERVVRGYNGINLTNWTTGTTAPQVEAGSVIEANGVLYDITTDTSISITGSADTYYLYLDVSGPDFDWLTTAPTWSDTLQGWYSSTDRFTGHIVEWDGASAFENKTSYVDNKKESEWLNNGVFDVTANITGSKDFRGLKTRDAKIEKGLECYALMTDQASNASTEKFFLRIITRDGTLDGGGGATANHGLSNLTLNKIASISGSIYDASAGRAYDLAHAGYVYITATQIVVTTSGTYANDEFSIVMLLKTSSATEWGI